MNACMQALRIATDPDALDAFRDSLWGEAHRLISDHVVVKGGSRFPLDIGTGSMAQLARELAAAGSAIGEKVLVTSLDIHEQNVRENSGFVGSNVMLVHHDVHEPLGFEDGYFDGLTSSFCIEYIERRRLNSTLRHLGRVLKIGSPVALAVYGMADDDNPVACPLDTMMDGRWNRITGKQLAAHMSHCGYREMEVKTSTCSDLAADFPTFSEMTLFSVVTAVYRP